MVMDVASEIVLINDEETVVMSKSIAGRRYNVQLAHCECPGFQFRGECRHIPAAALARREYRTQFPGPRKDGK
jgi:hypothetical protein